jgi:hypothetical protein
VNTKDALDAVGTMLGMVFLVTGAAMWMRWGWTGIKVLWQFRSDLDTIVRKDVERTVLG